MVRLWNVQQAIYDALAGDPLVMSMITSLSDTPEQNQRHPYVLLGDATGAPQDLLIETGATITETLHIWDRDAPISRAALIMGYMVNVLHGRKLTLASAQAVDCFVEFSEINRDAEFVHGILRVRVITFG